MNEPIWKLIFWHVLQVQTLRFTSNTVIPRHWPAHRTDVSLEYSAIKQTHGMIDISEKHQCKETENYCCTNYSDQIGSMYVSLNTRIKRKLYSSLVPIFGFVFIRSNHIPYSILIIPALPNRHYDSPAGKINQIMNWGHPRPLSCFFFFRAPPSFLTFVASLFLVSAYSRSSFHDWFATRSVDLALFESHIGLALQIQFMCFEILHLRPS